MRTPFAASFVLVFASGCFMPTPQGEPTDSGLAFDAGDVPDSGAELDAGGQDDAGLPPSDEPPIVVDPPEDDAGTLVDAGSFDAGATTDSGAATDSGIPVPDAGSFDAGCASGPGCEVVVATRLTGIVAKHVTTQFPPKGTCWGDVTYAFSALQSNQDVAGANALLASLETKYPTVLSPTLEPPCYWANALIARAMLLNPAAGRLTGPTALALKPLLLNFVQQRSRFADGMGTVWLISGSENHDLMRKGAFLSFTQILMAAGNGATVLADGKTVAEHHTAWTRWWKEYFRQRAREGIAVEIASPTYGKYSVQLFYNVRDLASDASLRKRAEDFLTLYWADWAQDQLPRTGVRGGAQTRCYKDTSLTAGNADALRAITWAFGWHPHAPPSATNPAVLAIASSSYRPPPIVDAIATRAEPHKYVSRRFGKGLATTDLGGLAYNVMFDGGTSHIRRDTWWTPDYVMGTLSVDSNQDYIALLNQNRAMGVYFASGVDDRIVIAGRGTDQPLVTADGGTLFRRGYAEIRGISGKDCMVVARDVDATRNNGTRVFVSNGALTQNQETQGGWWFSRTADAFIGIRPATGTWTAFGTVGGTYFDLTDLWSPVVVQTGRSVDYADFAAFRTSVVANTWDYSAGRIRYMSEAGNTFEVWRQSAALPRIDGMPVNLSPTLVYDSPYLSGTHGTDTVQLKFPGMSTLTLTFSP